MLPTRRLHNQYIARPFRSGPSELLAWFGAVQAQEYEAARWGLALRLRRTTRETDIERAIDAGDILRTHVMRPTWHFVPAADLGWMLQLTAPRVHRMSASYYRHQGLETAFLVKAAALFERAVAGGRYLTRAELGRHLADAGRQVNGIQLALVTMYAELEGVICSGPRRGKQSTYGLLSERAPLPRVLTREEALAELTRRFFRSHGPATIRDFVWWSGLTTADAKRGLDMIGARAEPHDGLTYWSVGQVRIGRTGSCTVHLLPIYDEYLVAYRDRVAVPHGPGAIRASARSPVIFQHALVVDGQVVGTWRNRRTTAAHVVDVATLRRLTTRERRALEEAANRYREYLNGNEKFSVVVAA